MRIIIVSFLTLALAVAGGFVLGAWLFFPVECLNNCDCPELPSESYLVTNYSWEDNYFYADLDDMTRIKHIGGGVFVGAK